MVPKKNKSPSVFSSTFASMKKIVYVRNSKLRTFASQAPSPGLEIRVNHWAKRWAHFHGKNYDRFDFMKGRYLLTENKTCYCKSQHILSKNAE